MLRVSRLSLRYPNGKLALSEVGLEVQAGELLIVLGGNGCGKTTLLRCVTRALMPTAGEVWLNGAEISRLAGEKLRRARLDLAMISQHANLVRRRSVLANVASGTLGRHQTWWTALGGLPAGELPAAREHLQRGRPAAPGGAAGRHAVRRPGAARRDRAGAGAAAAGDAGRRAGGEPRSRGRAGHHAPAAPPGASTTAWRCCACCTRSIWPSPTPTGWSACATAGSAFDRKCADLSRDAVQRLYLAEAA